MNIQTPEQKEIGKNNFYNVVGINRREMLQGTLAAGVISGAGLGGMYFGYTSAKTLAKPVRVGWIGTGDEGGVLISNHTPGFQQIIAICDIRPFNIHRAFHGDCSSESALANRQGLMRKYGWKSEDEARKNVKVYTDVDELLRNPDIEAVVIALPLHLHAPIAIKAIRAGKHVLTEKLMGYSVHECKEMGREAMKAGLYLAVGHQRHYSILYDNAVDTIRQGLLGDIHHIRAQWNRNNLPGHDSWQPPLPNDPKLAKSVESLAKQIDDLKKAKGGFDQLQALLEQTKAQIADQSVDAAKYGYEARTLELGGKPYIRAPLEELIRWRLWGRTGGGLMAELGSHQLDAAGIFISATRSDRKKVHPLTVAAVGGRSIFPPDRDCEDHVYCTYEFPGPKYYSDFDKKIVADPNDKIVVTYASINGNPYGGYGEIVMGTKAALVLETEATAQIYPNSIAGKVGVGVTKKGVKEMVLDTTQSGAPVAKAAIEQDGKISRGYTEELEHWAWCIRHPAPSDDFNPDKHPENFPRCHPKVALGDAVIALTTNIAMTDPKKRTNPKLQELNQPNHVQFDDAWYDLDSDETPEGVKPDLSRYT